MAHLNHMGPDEQGPKTGRILGKCRKTAQEKIAGNKYTLGTGMKKKRRFGCKEGKGTRSNAYNM